MDGKCATPKSFYSDTGKETSVKSRGGFQEHFTSSWKSFFCGFECLLCLELGCFEQ